MGTLFVLLLALPTASAQLPLQVNGLRGGRYVGSAGAISSAPRAVLGLGYGYTEGVIDGKDSHQRLSSELAGGWAPWRYLQLSLGFDARYDKHSTPDDSGGAFGTRLATRHAWQLAKEFSLAGRTAVHFPASKTVSRGFQAASPEFGVIGTYEFGPAYELSLDLGYRFDRSTHSVADPGALSAADRLGASLSKYDAALLGALFAMPIGPVTATAEWSWELATGSGAPSAAQSPMRARLAAQMKLSDRFVPGFEFGVSPSARPPIAKLARIEPRVWAAVTLGVVFEPRAQPKTAGPPPPVPVVQLEDALLDVHVLDPSGAPIPNAQVAIALGDARKELASDDKGSASFTLTPEQTQSLTVTSEGFEPHQAQIEGTRGRQTVTVTLSRKLPEGEIKGTVRSLRGGKLTIAHITVEPLGKSVDTDEKGDFLIVVPPGQYTLQITAPGHEPQERNAQVELLGVTILVVDLRRAPK